MRPFAATLTALALACACSPSGKRSTSSSGSSGGTGGSQTCPDGTGCTAAGGDVGLCCQGRCLDITVDPANCGACGYACPPGASCQAGVCSVASCAGAGQSLACTATDGTASNCCNGSCPGATTFDADPANCGFCGAGCPSGSTCQQGACVYSDGGSAACATNSDCPAGQSCSVNGCALSACTGAAPGAICNLAATASDTQGICCGNACTDPRWDAANCGACGFACPAGEVCLNGGCAANPTCGPTNWGETCLVGAGAPGACCGSSCVDTNTDSSNCGGCGNACPTGSTCQGGSCADSSGNPVSCSPPAQGCPAGTLCGNGQCQAATCSAGFGFCYLGEQSYAGICCGGSCVDPTQDPANCGTCGTSCGGSFCVSPGFTNANAAGECWPAAKSGACSAVGGCPQGETCVGGSCLENQCSSFASVFCATTAGSAGACCFDLSTFSASCTDLSSDVNNCGGCGTVCPGGQTCQGGLCSGSVAPCGQGHVLDGCALSDGGPGVCCPGGGCSDVNADVGNCGFCGNACTAGQSCVGGNCQ